MRNVSASFRENRVRNTIVPAVRLFMKKDGTVGEKDTSEIGNRKGKADQQAEKEDGS